MGGRWQVWNRGWRRGALLRALGLLLLTGGWLSVGRLLQGVAGHPHHPTVLEFAAAAVGFLCFSSGAALTLLGIHVHDQVAVPQRWARSPPGSSRQRSGST